MLTTSPRAVLGFGVAISMAWAGHVGAQPQYARALDEPEQVAPDDLSENEASPNAPGEDENRLHPDGDAVTESDDAMDEPHSDIERPPDGDQRPLPPPDPDGAKSPMVTVGAVAASTGCAMTACVTCPIPVATGCLALVLADAAPTIGFPIGIACGSCLAAWSAVPPALGALGAAAWDEGDALMLIATSGVAAAGGLTLGLTMLTVTVTGAAIAFLELEEPVLGQVLLVLLPAFVLVAGTPWVVALTAGTAWAMSE